MWSLLTYDAVNSLSYITKTDVLSSTWLYIHIAFFCPRNLCYTVLQLFFQVSVMPLIHTAKISTFKCQHSRTVHWWPGRSSGESTGKNNLEAKEELMLGCALFPFQTTGAEAIKKDKGGVHAENEEGNLWWCGEYQGNDCMKVRSNTRAVCAISKQQHNSTPYQKQKTITEMLNICLRLMTLFFH